MAFLEAENKKIDNWKTCHSLIWPFTWKISSVGKEEVDE